MRANPAVAKGAPRSDVNKNGDLGSCSRCSRRSARNSSPTTGWTLGVPCLTLRSCSVAVLIEGLMSKIWSYGLTRARYSVAGRVRTCLTVVSAALREFNPLASHTQIARGRCFKHDCAGLALVGPREDRSGCRSDTPRNAHAGC